MKKALVGFMAGICLFSHISHAGECRAWIQGALSHNSSSLDLGSNYSTTRYAEEILQTDILDDEASLEACIKVTLGWLFSVCPEIHRQTCLPFSRLGGELTLFAKEGEPASANHPIINQPTLLSLTDRRIMIEFDDCTYYISKFDKKGGRAEGWGDCDSFDFTLGLDPRFHAGTKMSDTVE